MTLMNIANANGFLEVLRSCEGQVEIRTKKGDVFNCKSRLAALVALTTIAVSPDFDEIEVITSNPEDSMRLLKFMMQGA